MYHNPHHNPCHYPYAGCPSMYGMPGMYMDIYEDQRRLMDMYPDIYRRIHPRVEEICHHMDVPSNPRMYPYVDPTMLGEMIDQVYQMEYREATTQQQGYLRDIITILFIQQLLGRRRRRYDPYQYGYVGTYPGYPGTIPGIF